MPVRGTVTLFHVRGIRIGVDYSWFFVLFLIIIWLSGYYRDLLGTSSGDGAPYLLAVASALAFFASILLHELGHAFVAIRRGIGISDITLWMFGGVARMTKDSDSPGTEFKIAIAGPLVTLAIGVACIAIGAGRDRVALLRTGDSPPEPDERLRGARRGRLARKHQPAHPGLQPDPRIPPGRRAGCAGDRVEATGDRNRATRAAARLGQVFSYVFIAIGIALFFTGDPIGGIWLGLIGFILGQAARGAVVQTEFASRIEGIRVADVMDEEPVAIPEDASVERALDEYFLRYRWPWFPVVDTYEQFLGLVERGAADAVPEPVRASSMVRDVFEATRPERSGFATTRRSNRCSETTPCGGWAP